MLYLKEKLEIEQEKLLSGKMAMDGWHPQATSIRFAKVNVEATSEDAPLHSQSFTCTSTMPIAT
ncbi:uncharacterized protein G2W53_027802 [Senna tora]|uniref:Uncharacterized protein n=1 Tax=Senna tora TaxID=362788 RepID=A0A834TJC3_9FABA|nr:uncharacterized protein G2W53_027802 [Senna tora]